VGRVSEGGRLELKRALACVALIGALFAGYAGAAWADDEPPPPTTTTPAPDPAPPSKPAPKPAPKRAPKPAHVYHAPAQTSTPAPKPTYTPPVVQHVTKAKVAHHARKHKRQHKRAKPVVTKPNDAQVKDASVVHIGGVPTAAVATNGSDALRRSLVIAGIGLAALLFLLVVTVPATAARYTPPGRVLMDHQTDLVLVGVGLLLLTALLFYVTNG
jgi:hypothetical protein